MLSPAYCGSNKFYIAERTRRLIKRSEISSLPHEGTLAIKTAVLYVGGAQDSWRRLVMQGGGGGCIGSIGHRGLAHSQQLTPD
ncbi:hypothetical protein JYU34_006250 [Plutella xylostella]|uniref:Uncharacterized protein n=1 Tax=Plutella xylostella TaxID=51655 RepID=A0ABQ7QRS1_PLUXY|nr:hypothetical protein JYU34_006250 [Plutella xylostella]